MARPDFSFERAVWRRGLRNVCGVDEVGRGAFAGPIVVAAVVFPAMGPVARSSPPTSSSVFVGLASARWDSLRSRHPSLIPDAGINDSKQLRPRQRGKLAKFIKENALSWGIGEVGSGLINRLGMARATKMAFRRAIAVANSKLKAQSAKVDFLLIDAFYIPYVRGLRRKYQKPIIRGDQKSLSIAAASILAKVYRDALMRKLSQKYPKYGWARNKGYGTREHQEAIKKYGMTKLHRKLFVESWWKKLRAKSAKVKTKTQNLKVLRLTLFALSLFRN